MSVFSLTILIERIIWGNFSASNLSISSLFLCFMWSLPSQVTFYIPTMHNSSLENQTKGLTKLISQTCTHFSISGDDYCYVSLLQIPLVLYSKIGKMCLWLLGRLLEGNMTRQYQKIKIYTAFVWHDKNFGSMVTQFFSSILISI